MASEPLVSIILPTYNGSRYLAESLQSCIDQTYRNWELVVVDDCSTDSTPQIIADFCGRDGRIRSIRNNPNRKLPGSLNVGFAASKGQFLTWTSDDNMYRPQAIERLLAFLMDHPNVGLVYSDYSKIDENGARTAGVVVGEPEWLAYHDEVGASFMYRREVYERIGGYDEALFCAEDYEYWLHAARYFKLQPLHEDLYLYRMHGASLTARQEERMLRGVEQALRRHLPHLSWTGNRARCKGYLAVASIAYRRGGTGSAMSALGRATLLSPAHVIGHVLQGFWRRGAGVFRRFERPAVPSQPA